MKLMQSNKNGRKKERTAAQPEQQPQNWIH